MLDIDCARCGRVLIGTPQIVAATTTGAGIRVAFVCSCGLPGGLLIGRRARRTTSPDPRPAMSTGVQAHPARTSGATVYNVIHHASAPGLRDALGPVRRRRRPSPWRRRRAAAAAPAAGPVPRAA